MNKKTLFTLVLACALPASIFAQATPKYPVKIDDYLTLSNVIKGDKITTVEFTINNIANLDAASKEDLTKDIVTGYIASVCKDKRALDAVSKGHVIQTNYRDEANNLLTSVAVDKNTCPAK